MRPNQHLKCMNRILRSRASFPWIIMIPFSASFLLDIVHMIYITWQKLSNLLGASVDGYSFLASGSSRVPRSGPRVVPFWVTHGNQKFHHRSLSGYPDLQNVSKRRSPGPLQKLTHFYDQSLVNAMNLGIWKFADGEKKWAFVLGI